MAKLKVKNLKNVQLKIRKKIITALRASPVRNGVGKIVVDEIQDGTFGAPSEKYREWRENNDGLNKTHKKYNRDNINITFTGELLNDLRKNVRANLSDGRAEYVIEHSDKDHKPYKTQKGKTKSAPFKKISKGLQKLYPYMTFHKGTQKKLLEFIKRELFKRIK